MERGTPFTASAFSSLPAQTFGWEADMIVGVANSGAGLRLAHNNSDCALGWFGGKLALRTAPRERTRYIRY
jgi:hypothetical protein